MTDEERVAQPAAPSVRSRTDSKPGVSDDDDIDDDASRLRRVGLILPSSSSSSSSPGIENDPPRLALCVLRRLLSDGSISVGAVAEVVRALTVEKNAAKGDEDSAATVGTAKKKRKAPVSPSVPPSATDEIDGAKTTTVAPSPSSTQRLLPHNNNRRTRHVALRFLYDGSTYSGFTENVGRPDDASVEKALFAALTKTCLVVDRQSAGYSRAGRTDRGVSAHGQVVALHVRSAIPPGSLIQEEDGRERNVEEKDLPRNSIDSLTCWTPMRTKKKKSKKKKQQVKKFGAVGDDNAATIDLDAPQPLQAKPQLVERTVNELDYAQILNNVLPPTIRVLGWCPVSPQFSARFSCSDRTYRYYFVRRNLDIDAMRQAVKLMVGRHDFRNLCKMDLEHVYNFEREILSARIVTPNNGGNVGRSDTASTATSLIQRQLCHVEIVGQAFLWHQVRCIVACLFLVGKRQEKPSVILELLDVKSNPGKPSYEMAPDGPLVLHGCGYRHLTFGHTFRNFWGVMCDLERKWEGLALAAERVRDGMESLRQDVTVKQRDVVKFTIGLAEERRKKERRRGGAAYGSTSKVDDWVAADKEGGDALVSLGEALRYVDSVLNTRPSPSGPKEVLHVPLMERSRGTTYEEKLNALLSGGGGSNNDGKEGGNGSTRRRDRYEENVVKKRKTAEEDKEFYELMLNQGGSGI